MGRYLIGIDEVGRGSLAGPLVAAAVAIPAGLRLRGLKDSKKLTLKQRYFWWQWLQRQQIKFAFARVYPKTIDRINITQAANLASTRACLKLKLPGRALLDGGLKLNNSGISYRTVIKGDEKYNAIKLASVVAKVHRDNIMKRNHYLYKNYGFAEHKGYGTKRHLEALKKHGPCPLHRLTFIGNAVK